jgi:outer membrane protein TolC
MRRTGCLLAVVGLTAISTSALADRALTLDDALQQARSKNNDLKAASTRIAQAQTGVDQALAALLPNVSASGKYTHNYKEVTLNLAAENQALFGLADVIKATSGNPIQNFAIDQFKDQVNAATPTAIVIQKGEQLDLVLSANVPLLVPWAYQGLTSQKQLVAAAKSGYAVTDAQVMVAVAQAFFAAAGTDELVGARRHAIEVARQTLDNAKARFEAGVVNRVEVTRAQIALLRAEQSMREATDAQATAYRSLRTIIQIDEPFHVVPGSEAPPLPSNDMKALAHDALKLRPEFEQLDHTIASQEAARASARWRWAPTLSAFGNLRAFNYAGFSGDNYSWAIGLSLDWLIYDGGVRDAQAKLAIAQKQESQYRFQQLKDTVTDDLFNARSSVDTKRAALETAVRSVGLSKETLDLVRVQHDAGTATQLDVLQAQDNLVLSEVAVAQARFDLAVAEVQLRRAAGLFPPKL